MKNIFEYILFLSCSKFFQLLGLNLSRRFSFLIAVLFYYIIPIRKKTVLENLHNAFPDYDEKKLKSIAFGSYKSFAIALAEILYIPAMSKEDIKKQVDCSNVELIREKYEENNGVILLSAHFGNWEFMATSLAAQLNIPISVVIKPQRNPYVTNWMNKARTKWNNEIVPLGISIRQTYQTIKDKKIVAMVADQRGPEESIKINFFERNLTVLTGPAALSLKTGAPILYGISVRQDDYSYKSVMTEISNENLPESNEEKIKELSQRHMAYLEGYIRKYPEQWLWMHKRWKH
ncbi:MAG: lysophospholipid acyltransferase family protein [Bacteroidetes bacterium]|nr:lysophospholipid acyltransferase family protein [Bacteroidota bacterium]MCH8032132.1 lysophospholipid acyltransferase family protein [Bacteroidota bacterium]